MNSSRRLGLAYVLLFATTGVSLPFAGLWLGAQGLDGARIGLVLAVPMLARLITGPMLAIWSDGFRLRRTPIAVLALTASAGYVLAGVAGLVASFWGVAFFWFLGATASAAVIPLLDVVALRRARAEGFDFSWPRGFGSAAFVVANVVMGVLLLTAPEDAVILWVVAGSLGLAVAAWRWLPDERVAPPGGDANAPTATFRARYGGLGRLMRDRAFLTAILASGSIQAAHGFYYGFSALLWKGQGIGEPVIGLLWAVAVAAEIAFLWWGASWLRRRGVGALGLLMLGGGAAIIRWGVLAVAPPLALLWPLQILHALTFAATYLAGVDLVQRLAPPDAHTAGQVLNSTLSAGVLIGLATLASGPLFDAAGAGGYLAMAALSAVGLVAAARLAKESNRTGNLA